MTPELLALLTPEQQEVWRIHGIASYMPSAYVADALLELAQMKRDFRDCVKSHQKANAELEMLWAAVADAPHDIWCAVTFPAAPAELMPCNCWKSETK